MPNATCPTATPFRPTTPSLSWSTRTCAAARSRGLSCEIREADRARRALSLRRPLRRPEWSTIPQIPNAQDDRACGLEVLSLYRFGETPAAGSTPFPARGPVYRLHVSGQPNTPTCTPTPRCSPRPRRRRHHRLSRRLRFPRRPASPCKPLRLAHCRVPRVIGLRPAAARTRIRRGQLPHRPNPVQTGRAARGRVLTQAPRPGARRPRGTRVSFTVSRGQRT